MKQLSIVLAIAGCITLTTLGADAWRKQQERQRQQAMNEAQMAQRVGVQVSRSTMYSLDPYNQRQAQAYNDAVAKQQAAFTARATGKKQ